MTVEIETEAAQFPFWDFFFLVFDTVWVLPVTGQVLLPALSDQVYRSLLHLHAGQLSTRTNSQADFFI
jgi:hypothetical protein